MNIKRALLASATIIALSAPAFAADKENYETTTKIEKDAKGNFHEKAKTTKTEMDGTFNSFEKKVDISVDSKGNTDKTITTESVVDAKGLGNKHVTKTKDTETVKNGETKATHEASVDGKSVKADSSFEKDANGNYERKDTIARTDAAGTTRTSETKVNVKVDDNGNTKKTSVTENTTDPEGLGNKTSVKTTDTTKTTADETTITHEKKINGDVVNRSSYTGPAR
jgi:hypothetical protein